MPFVARAAGANDAVQLERVVYLTKNLDSLTKSFAKRGFRIVSGRFDPLGYSANFVWLPTGQTIELGTTYTRDTNDWRFRAIRAYGTHVAGIRLRVRSIAQTYTMIAQPKTMLQRDSSFDTLSAVGPTYGFGLEAPKPLDVVFVGSDTAWSLQGYDAPPDSGYYRITWLLLTTSDSTEALIRRTFDDLGLHRSHAGCCDYWVIGPPENRTAIRFELPSTTFRGEGDWLSIEAGGIVFD